MNRNFRVFFGFVFAYLVFIPIQAFSLNNEISKSNPRPDLALISGKKFPLVVNNVSYDIYYGIILGESSIQDYDGKIISMSIIPEKKSLLINFDNILQTDNAWIRFPDEVISANNDKFVLLVNGIENGYELSSHGSDTRLGFVIKAGTTKVEIIGNNVVPEFPIHLLTVFLMTFCAVILLTRNHMKKSIQI